MDLQRENHSELNLAEDSRRQQRKGKGVKSSILETEQQMSSVEIEFQKAFQDLQGNDKDCCTGKLIAGILGVICLILIYSIVRVVEFIPCHFNPRQCTTNQRNQTGNQTTGNQKVYHCGQCPPEWFTYSNNCYYISTEQKTWTESLKACASKSSNLLYIDDKEEMNFLNIFNIHPWIGLSQRNNTKSWVWTTGTTLSSKLFSKISKLDKNCVFADFYSHMFYSESCVGNKTYICKHQSH